MLSIFTALPLTFLFASSVLAQYPESIKRGLVSVSSKTPQDNQLFVQPNNGLTWYYNYAIAPTVYSNYTQSDIEFVPMLWGLTNTTNSTFYSNVTSMIAKGRNITHVLSFNEPDQNLTAGGSQISPDAAAASWILNFDPLRKLGVKVGAPVVYANASGFAWLDKFYTACKIRNSSCTADFMNIHCFGNISFVSSYLAEYKEKYPGLPLWITEFALPYSSFPATEGFFNESIALFDNDTTVERYSYFGSFRASVSNVGWNATMLDGGGKLRNIGSWYLGGAEVKAATTTTATSTAAATSTNTASSDADMLSNNRMGILGSVVLVTVAAVGLL